MEMRKKRSNFAVDMLFRREKVSEVMWKGVVVRTQQAAMRADGGAEAGGSQSEGSSSSGSLLSSSASSPSSSSSFSSHAGQGVPFFVVLPLHWEVAQGK
jgi:uncharacterized membrane protein